ncbi:MAG: response regulator [Sediminibacterium sp.]|nr:response regulator [Sediminibacterium sp.]
MSDSNNLLNILVVEDNPADLFVLEALLWKTRLQIGNILKTTSYAETVVLLNEQKPNLILLDLSLTDSSGIESFLHINQLAPTIPIIVLTGLVDTEMALETMARGAQDYLVKGEFDEKLLAKSIKYSIERKKNLENIRVSRELYSSLFYNNPMAIYIWDMDTLQILEVNGVAEKEYGYSKAEFLVRTLWDLRPQESHAELKRTLENYRQGQFNRASRIWKHHNRKGETIFMEISTHPIDYNGKQAMMSIAHNVTSRITLERKLEEERVMKQKEIAEAVIVTQEKERHDISRELHDNVNQQLTVAMMYIASAEKKQGSSDLLKQSANYVLNAIEEIRSLTKSLVTPLIKDFGLVKAIESILEDVGAVKEMKMEFTADNFYEDDIEYDFKLSIFRIIQEQVNNILKHADAYEVNIRLSRTSGHIQLSITDDGIGFDLMQQKKGIGLYNITTRVELFNGEIRIDTAPNKGCAMHIQFPLSEGILLKR